MHCGKNACVYQLTVDIGVKTGVKTVHTNIFVKHRKLHKFATTDRNFKKIIFADMHDRKTYMYINVQ